MLRENERVVFPKDDIALPDTDTVVTGTVTMLSDKLQALDIVEIEGDSAVRKGRLLLDQPITPYEGGIINARIRVIQTGITGYMIRSELLDWEEIAIDRGTTQESVDRLLSRQENRLERLVKELGFDAWVEDGSLMLSGYDPETDVLIWSMAGRAVLEGIVETRPLLIFWIKPSGKIKRVFLTLTGRVFERD